jgi:hypothetical protein
MPTPVALTALESTPVPEEVIVTDVAALEVSTVDPEAKLPEALAELFVHRVRDAAGEELFGLTGKSVGNDLPYTVTRTQLRPPDIGLGKVSGEGEFPSEIFAAICGWSRNQRTLVEWISELRVHHGDGLRLIVWDDTDYDIPWELLWLDEDEERGLAAGCLGALVNVARWTTIQEISKLPLDYASECSGDVVGYFDETMHADAAAFQAFTHHPYYKMSAFLDQLRRDDLRAGLLYIGCHGEYGSSVYRLMLDTFTWGELNLLEMAALRKWPTLAFLNACHSGRFVHNIGQGEDALRGFAELFLRKGARACLASSGKVGDDEAHALIRQLIKEVTALPGLPVAFALRKFRAEAAATLSIKLPELPRTRNDDGSINKEGQKRVLRFLYSFMFLYYGHPDTTLRLSPLAADSGP